MSDTSHGPGWWQASDGRWYEPHLHPQYRPSPPPQSSPPSSNPYGQPQYRPQPLPFGYGGAVVPSKICFACGSMVVATAAVCTQCGTMLGTPKDKTVAVLLAVFLAPWNWLYTYKRDAAKFWIGLSVVIIGFILTVVIIGFFMIVGVWLWAVIDAATKPDPYYRQFPNG